MGKCNRAPIPWERRSHLPTRPRPPCAPSWGRGGSSAGAQGLPHGGMLCSVRSRHFTRDPAAVQLPAEGRRRHSRGEPSGWARGGRGQLRLAHLCVPAPRLAQSSVARAAPAEPFPTLPRLKNPHPTQPRSLQAWLLLRGDLQRVGRDRDEGLSIPDWKAHLSHPT